MTLAELKYINNLKELIKTQKSIIYYLQGTSKRENWRLLLQDLYTKCSVLRKEINNFYYDKDEKIH
jgi:hypothetical protein